jgi:hypothetical protein
MTKVDEAAQLGSSADTVAAIREWLKDNWDPDLSPLPNGGSCWELPKDA